MDDTHLQQVLEGICAAAVDALIVYNRIAAKTPDVGSMPGLCSLEGIRDGW